MLSSCNTVVSWLARLMLLEHRGVYHATAPRAKTLFKRKLFSQCLLCTVFKVVGEQFMKHRPLRDISIVNLHSQYTVSNVHHKSENKKLVVTSASLLVTSALLVVTRSY